MKTEDTKTLIDDATEIIQERITQSVWWNMHKTTRRNRSRLVGRYAAAFAAEFQAWIGATYPFVRSERARFVLAKHIRSEFRNNHIGLLHDFAQQFDASNPRPQDRDWVSAHLDDVRRLFNNSRSCCGLRGLAALTLLENASRVFIPVLEAAATKSGFDRHDYTRMHGEADEADIEHCQDLMLALEDERFAEYPQAQSEVLIGARVASSLVLRVFANP